MNTFEQSYSDLLQLATEIAESVASMTNSTGIVELFPLRRLQDEMVYQLHLRKSGSEAPPSDLGVYSLGYPIYHWDSVIDWEKDVKPNDEYRDFAELKNHFQQVTSIHSRLMFYVRFLKQISGHDD